jgi:DUF1680 family protein
VSIQTEFPWGGKVLVQVDPEEELDFDFHLRVPGWAVENPVPGNLYSFVPGEKSNFSIQVNGKAAKFKMENGYAVLSQNWKKGDQITYTLPMPIRELQSRPEVSENIGRIAIQRGPLVYCIEGTDNAGTVSELTVSDTPNYQVEELQILDERVLAVRFSGNKAGEAKSVLAIPYYTWANRGPNEMRVWIPKE